MAIMINSIFIESRHQILGLKIWRNTIFSLLFKRKVIFDFSKLLGTRASSYDFDEDTNEEAEEDGEVGNSVSKKQKVDSVEEKSDREQGKMKDIFDFINNNWLTY